MKNKNASLLFTLFLTAVGNLSTAQADTPSSLAFWAASENDLVTSPCKTQQAPSLDEVNQYLATLSGKSVTEVISGVQITDEPKTLIQAFRDLVGNNNVQLNYSISPVCQKVLCAVDLIWGEEVGRKLLFMKLKHGFNGSEFAHKDSSRFDLDSLDQVLTTLSDLPSNLQLLGRGKNQRLALSAEGSDYTYKKVEGLVAADSEIKLYPRWKNNTDSYRKQYSLFHELGHNVGYRESGVSFTPGGWENLHQLKGGCAISKYSQTNPTEDFAESFAAYRYNGSNLKANCFEKFDYLKSKIFAGVEYTDELACAVAPKVEKKKFRLKDLFRKLEQL